MCKTPPTKGYTCNCNPVTVHLWEHCGNKCVWESSLCVCIYGITWHHMTSFYSLSTVELIACHMTSHIIILHCPYSCELIVCHMTFYTVPTVELYRVSHDITWHHSALSLQLWAVSCVTHKHRSSDIVAGVKSLQCIQILQTYGADFWSEECTWSHTMKQLLPVG